MSSIFIHGQPRPQGSLQLAVNKKTGKGFAKYSSTTIEWRNTLYGALVEWWGGKEPLEGPVSVTISFLLRRPKNHYGSGKNSSTVKDAAPRLPTGPDIDKLCRAVLDACTDAQVWHDDSQVVTLRADKMFATKDEGVGAGILIQRAM